jgi:hypothetical protein
MTWRNSLSVAAVLAGAVVLLYRKSLRLYWTYDDPWFLHVALMRRWTEGFTHADVWRHNLFTPLLTATYELFVAAFWLEPRRWYAAQLVLLVAVALAIYAALRLYVAVMPAAAGALLFAIGPPLAHATVTIYVIHYLEAMLLGALSLIAFEKRRDAMSALLYFAAILAKEIAVPLPVLLFLLAREKRWRRVMPHAAALAVYAAWRIGLVGWPVGYGWQTGIGDLARVPWEFARMFGAAGAVLLAAAAMVIAAGLQTKRAVLIAMVTLLLSVVPILPVAREMQPRFALMPWLWACTAFAFGVAAMRRRVLAASAVIVLAVVANRQEWTVQYSRARRMSDEAHVWVHERGDVLLRNPAIPPGTMPELEWLKEEFFHHEKGARWFYDDIYLCLRPVEGRRILEYNPRSRRVEEVNAGCPPVRNDVPMTAAFERRGNELVWRFGPHTGGAWRLILNDGEQAWDVPPESAYRIGAATRLALRIGYRSPHGWVTYSPEIALDFTRQTKTTWRR